MMNIKLSYTAQRVLKLAAITAAVIAGVMVFYKLLAYFAPFFIAYILSLIIEPIIRFSSNRLHIRRKLAAPISILLILSALGFLIFLAVSRLIIEIVDMTKLLPDFFNDLYSRVLILLSTAREQYEWIPADITADLGSFISSMSNTLTSVLNTIIKSAYSTAVSVPEILIFIIVTIMSTYFLTSDRERIYGFFRKQFPESWGNKFISLKNDMFSAFFGYIKAQLILMSITFTELFIGLTLINVKYSLLFALLISLIDALPILGTGTVLIPWGVFSLVTGNIKMGISVLLLYGVVLVVRQLTEPKILGHQIGVYPLLTLVAMYAGLRLLGFVGLILGPVTLLILKNIFTEIFKKRTLKEILENPDKSLK